MDPAPLVVGAFKEAMTTAGIDAAPHEDAAAETASSHHTTVHEENGTDAEPEAAMEAAAPRQDDGAPPAKKKRVNPPRIKPPPSVLNAAREESPEALADKQERTRIKNLRGLVTRAVYDRHNRSRNLLALCADAAPAHALPSAPEFACGADLANETLELLLSLTRDNMRALYDATPGWQWSDTAKRGELRNERMRWLIVWADAARTVVAGFTAFRLSADSGVAHLYVHELQVASAHRRKGIGAVLMALVEAIAARSQMSLIMLTVLGVNQDAIRFYARFGFSIDEASPGPCYNLEGDGAYRILAKVLNDACLRFACDKCGFRCRYPDTLEQHESYAHARPWAFACPVEGCGRGTVLAPQLQKHLELAHGWAASEPPRPASAKEDGGDLDTRGAELLNDRVELKAPDGRKGTVVKANNGFFTVRLDGAAAETVVCRLSAFEGFEAQPPRPKKDVDPDYELALRLQKEDGWSRKSTRVRR